MTNLDIYNPRKIRSIIEKKDALIYNLKDELKRTNEMLQDALARIRKIEGQREA